MFLYRKLSKSPDKKGKDWGGEGVDDSAISGAESSLSPSPLGANNDIEDSSSDANLPKVNPLKWTVSTHHTVHFQIICMPKY